MSRLTTFWASSYIDCRSLQRMLPTKLVVLDACSCTRDFFLMYKFEVLVRVLVREV